ncbi:uncharacterized protein (DUF58 family) [Allocatelliglobosispora scoriae]|uniref:Uncharacterized protein (DUF58 family) n=1 Tax=Allocatelliglobosispora scoriae TaxID=643052 RepID=A0A841BPD5_9ACTN|nr:DUF58 domain-containing protein [Allocatelliglobosispora scoriae]MBB5870134.1 uncharacterized protein (DUF58 family) [Allocatelliglobosispora scoriae]
MTAASDRLLRRLEWQVVRRLDGRLQGAYRTAWRGVGIDFTDLRAYTPEDDVRHIDWNVSARMDETFVRQYTEERDLTAWLVLDRSASMRGGTARQGKDSALSELAIVLARLLSQNGNRVGAVLFDNDRQRVISPRTGRSQALRLAHELDRPEPAGGPGTTTDLAAMLRLAATTASRRGLVFVLSDFIGDPGWERALAMLAHRHEVVTVRIVDPAELDLPDMGLVFVEDAETGEQILVDTSDPLLRQRLRAEVWSREVALTETMRQAGVTAHRITTDQDLVAALVGMVRQSGRRSR